MSRVSFPDGAIAVNLPVLETALYDVSNQVCMAQFDGCGNIAKFSQIGKGDIIEPGFHYCAMQVDSKPVERQLGVGSPVERQHGVGQKKTVTMIGRMQRVHFELDCLSISLAQFLDEKTNAVFTRYDFQNHSDEDIEISLCFGVQGLVPLALDSIPYLVEVERLQGKRYYTLQISVEAKGCRAFRYILSPGGEGAVPGFEKAFGAGEIDALEYIGWLEGLWPYAHEPCANDKIRALYISCINTAASAYKSIPEAGFEAFFAGISYQAPARTYFRDGFFTALCLLEIKPEWVKNQILTLARGVNADGSCPSAVIASPESMPFWDGHYDSPAFLIILAYEYTVQTNDHSLLGLELSGQTILQVFDDCLGWLDSQTDETGLVVKPGGCRLDWADNVYREGYVTYIEALYARAVYAMAAFKRSSGSVAEADALEKKHERIKGAINDLLWDDDRGFYINYASEAYREDNLSLDTILCVLFDIADDEMAKRHLENCRKLLEADFGVRCVAPLYKYQHHLVEKSAFPTRYHNGSDWPYLDGLYALALMKHGFDASHALTRWFDYSLEQGWYTPVEYYSPAYGKGSLLQAWSSTAAYALQKGWHLWKKK